MPLAAILNLLNFPIQAQEQSRLILNQEDTIIGIQTISPELLHATHVSQWIFLSGSLPKSGPLQPGIVILLFALLLPFRKLRSTTSRSPQLRDSFASKVIGPHAQCFSSFDLVSFLGGWAGFALQSLPIRITFYPVRHSICVVISAHLMSWLCLWPVNSMLCLLSATHSSSHLCHPPSGSDVTPGQQQYFFLISRSSCRTLFSRYPQRHTWGRGGAGLQSRCHRCHPYFNLG